MSKRYLVTGALGCVGSWTIKHLVERGDHVLAGDVSTDRTRLRLVAAGSDVEGEVEFVRADVTDRESLGQLVSDHSVERIIHLAALQVPASHANPSAGALVNVVGTTNVLDIVRSSDTERAVFASSVAVFGTETAGTASLRNDADQRPETFYGVFKRADESVARLFHRHYGVDSLGLRPHTIYGPGRDTGMTSSPTWAMLAAARGEDYKISFSGSVGMQHASDVALIFIHASDVGGDGSTYSIKGAVADMAELARLVDERSSGSKISAVEDNDLPFAANLDDSELRSLLGDLPDRSISDGIDTTIAHFASADHALLPRETL
jgi:nucleoside-diphosphate-sugar epimerase